MDFHEGGFIHYRPSGGGNEGPRWRKLWDKVPYVGKATVVAVVSVNALGGFVAARAWESAGSLNSDMHSGDNIAVSAQPSPEQLDALQQHDTIVSDHNTDEVFAGRTIDALGVVDVGGLAVGFLYYESLKRRPEEE